MTDPSIAVHCSGITKSFPAADGMVEVLHGIDFEVPAGELTMLVGPSGCGKTTLISIIAGILTPTSGEVEICGSPITRMTDAVKVAFRRANIGFIFQQYNLLPALTAAENAAIPLVAAGMPMARAAGSPRRSSAHRGGRASRQIAEPTLRRPAAAGCDRPCIGPRAAACRLRRADRGTRRRVRPNRAGDPEVASDRAVIVVTHDTRIYAFADRIASMEDGRIRTVRIAPFVPLSEAA